MKRDYLKRAKNISISINMKHVGQLIIPAVNHLTPSAVWVVAGAVHLARQNDEMKFCVLMGYFIIRIFVFVCIHITNTHM